MKHLRLALAGASLIALSACATAAPPPAAPAPPPVAETAKPAETTAPPIAYTDRTLPNGLRVLAVQDKTTPNVTVQVWYGVGSKDDPLGRSGFAHLFEHLMFKATRNFPAETLDRMTEDVGGFNNASTYDDFTNYYEVAPAEHLQRLLWAEAQRLGGLVVDEANFKSERDVVKEELRQRVLASPYGRLFSLYVPIYSYTVHPYRRPGIGSIEQLDAATVDDVRAFHATYYRPDNATLIVGGNFDPAQLDAWVDQYFGPLKPPATPQPRVTAVEPPRTGARTIDTYGPNVPLPAVAITWLGAKAADPDAAAIQVLDAILSTGKSSRLYDSLVYDKKIAQQAFSGFELPADKGLVYVGAIMASGHSLEEGQAALLAEVQRLRDAPPTAAELAEAKSELVAAKLRERETIDDRAFALGYALETTGDPARANTDIAALQAVTAEDVQRVARLYLDPAVATTIRYRPETERPKGAADPAPAEPKVASVRYTGPVTELAPAGQREAPPPLGQPVAPALPKPAETRLENGLRVIVARSSDLPLVTASLVVKAGAAVDPAGLAGAASFTADMLTEGTTTRSAPQIARETEALGAELDSSAGWESSSVTLSAPRGGFPAALAVMADVAQHPAFAPAEVDRVRAEALDGLSVALETPGPLAGMAQAPVVFAGTPYGHVADGTPASLRKIAPADLAALHAAWWRPDNAVLVLTGDMTPEEGFALARQAFGGWTAPAAPLPAQPVVNPSSQPKVVAIDLPGTGQAAVIVAKPAIPRGDPRYYQGLVANAVIGGGYSARLNSEIRVKRGLSYGAGSSLSARRTTGAFTATVQTKNESAAEVAGLIKQQLAELGATPPQADELRARKSSLVGDFGREVATSGGLAQIIGALALYDIDLGELSVYTAKVDAVTADQAAAFARDVLNPGQASVIVVGDQKSFMPALKKALPNAVLVPAGQLDLDSPTLRKGGK